MTTHPEDTRTIHIDELHNIVDGILGPFYVDSKLMYTLYCQIKRMGRLKEMDESWREDVRELDDPDGWIENIVRGHVYDVLWCKTLGAEQ